MQFPHDGLGKSIEDLYLYEMMIMMIRIACMLGFKYQQEACWSLPYFVLLDTPVALPLLFLLFKKLKETEEKPSLVLSTEEMYEIHKE